MSDRMYYLMCPIGPSSTPPSVAAQIQATLLGRTWRPQQECEFHLRALADDETREELESAWPHALEEIWRSRYMHSSPQNVRVLTRQYRCLTHNLPPRVFRQQHAYAMNREARPSQANLEWVYAYDPDHAHADPRATIPPEFLGRRTFFRVWLTRRPPARSTHQIWPQP